MSGNSGPGYAEHPEHRVSVAPVGAPVRVRVNGELIAESAEALRLDESHHAPTFYLPRKDVRMGRLVRSAHHTYCPFKGEASYFSVAGGAQNAAWSYEQPYDEVREIRELLAFYAKDGTEIAIG